jgi:5'-nucleotidase
LLKEKLFKFRTQGPEHLSIVADFDQTLTKYFYPPRLESRGGEEMGLGDSSMKVLLGSQKYRPEHREETRDLYLKYRPVELDQSLSLEQKEQHMKDWWTANMKTFSSVPLHRSDFHPLVLGSRLVLRHGILEMLSIIDSYHLPMVVVSGGIKPVIESALQIARGGDPNGLERVEVVSNDFVYEKDSVRGYDERILHSMNKN